ncbi:MAG: hypothetical protein RL685_5699 [Pseudomonadota bacterium]|jgi:hypothetical protein
MRRALAAILASLLTWSCKEERTTCANADYSECGTPLPAQQPNGQPWPTFSEALAEALECPNSEGPEANVVLRGQCVDGKQFITRNQVQQVQEGFYDEVAGNTRFFREGTLVGIFHFSAEGGRPCQCPENGFTGPPEAVHCVGAPGQPLYELEPLCGTVTPRGWRGSFFREVSGCSCDPLPDY